MSKFAIEKEVPKPMRNRGAKYPWHEMEVGDSFFIPGKTMKQLGGLTSAASKRHGRRYSARSVEGGVRIWRDE